MRKQALLSRILLLAGLMLSTTFNIRSQTAVGHWRDCLDFSRVQHVSVTPDGIYAAGRGGLFRYDPEDNTLATLSRSTGMSDVGIATMAYGNGCLVVGYNNSNIDIIEDSRIHNLSDIKRSSISGDRDIYSIRFHNGMAYLCTGFGVVVINLQRHEIKETYYLGAVGTYTAVYDMAFTDDSIYVSTAEGVKRLSIAEQHPGISERWDSDHRMDGYTVTRFETVGGNLLAAGHTGDPEWCSLFKLEPGGKTLLHSGELASMQQGGGKLAICLDGKILTYDTALNYIGEHSTYIWGNLEAIDAVYSDDGTLWVGHPWEGLVGLYADGSEKYLKPDGPANSDNVFRLTPINDEMALCPGGRLTTYTASYTPANIFFTNGRRWNPLDNSNGMLGGIYDIVDAVKADDDIYAATWGSGLLKIKDRQVTAIYDHNNSDGALLQYTMDGWSTLIIGAVAWDPDGKLWMLNSRSPKPLVSLSNGQWKSYSTESMTGTVPELDKIIFDSVRHYIWFAGRTNNIYVHDGQSRMARINPNQGSKLETETVNTMVQDRDGNIWIGTNKGIKVIYDGYRAFQNGGNGETAPVSCSNITITNGSFAEYLMAYENITCIAVDGANRKWVGTAAGGLYLLSSNGVNQLENFTTANSPLFSDKIVCLGIMPSTGDVYIGTDHGLQLYRSTATYAEPFTADRVYAYPNPVKPGYDGPIAIKGLVRDGIVHITDASGHTVYTTQALGGQAIWNGRTQSGEAVSSGVYYVFASDIDGNNRSVAKILIIR